MSFYGDWFEWIYGYLILYWPKKLPSRFKFSSIKFCQKKKSMGICVKPEWKHIVHNQFWYSFCSLTKIYRIFFHLPFAISIHLCGIHIIFKHFCDIELNLFSSRPSKKPGNICIIKSDPTIFNLSTVGKNVSMPCKMICLHSKGHGKWRVYIYLIINKWWR